MNFDRIFQEAGLRHSLHRLRELCRIEAQRRMEKVKNEIQL